MSEHFAQLYETQSIQHFVYNSKQLARIDTFASDSNMQDVYKRQAEKMIWIYCSASAPRRSVAPPVTTPLRSVAKGDMISTMIVQRSDIVMPRAS